MMMTRLRIGVVALLTAAASGEFTAIDGNVSQTAIGIQWPAFCERRRERVVDPLFTIRPSPDNKTVALLTDPKNLVTVKGSRILVLTYNMDVAETHDTGGIIVQFPPDQLEEIHTCCSATSQILDGFTNLKRISMSTSSNTRGVFNQLPILPAPRVDISTSAQAELELSAPINVEASTSSQLTLKGSVGQVTASTSARVVMEGAILLPGQSSVSSSAEVRVSTKSCENVAQSSSGDCIEDDSISVSVTVGDQFKRQGRRDCVKSSAPGLPGTSFLAWMGAGSVLLGALLF